MNKDEALRLALEALEKISMGSDPRWADQAITAIEAVLEAKDEPVGKFAKFTDGIWREVTDGSAGVPLYTTPPQRTWVGLTNDELTDLFYNTNLGQESAVGQAIALLKERNT
jgi:hypothetical protein